VHLLPFQTKSLTIIPLSFFGANHAQEWSKLHFSLLPLELRKKEIIENKETKLKIPIKEQN